MVLWLWVIEDWCLLLFLLCLLLLELVCHLGELALFPIPWCWPVFLSNRTVVVVILYCYVDSYRLVVESVEEVVHRFDVGSFWNPSSFHEIHQVVVVVLLRFSTGPFVNEKVAIVLLAVGFW